MPSLDLPIHGGAARRVGNILAHDAAFSPDGETIAYTHGKGMYLTGRSGAGTREIAALPGTPASPRWSPDGRVLRFSFKDERAAGFALWEMPSNGGPAHPLFEGFRVCSDVMHGSWTRDGSLYMFDCADAAGTNLWGVREGSSPWRGRPQPARLTYSPISLSSPVATADGKRIFALAAARRAELVRYDAGTQSLAPYLSGTQAFMLDFSRDGAWVTYATFNQSGLWRSKLDGSDKRLLVSSPGLVAYPRWSPDGRWIAYCSGVGRSFRIYLIPSSGGSPRELAPGTDNQAHPSWSPDGGTLAFAGAPWLHDFAPGSTAVHLFHLQTRQIETLPGSQGLWSPRWSPDGRYIAAMTADSHKLVAFDLRARKWADLANLAVDYTCWSRDGKYLYLTVNTSGQGLTAYRVCMRDRKIEPVLSLPDVRLPQMFGYWFGLAPDDAPLFLHDRTAGGLYALDWRAG
jgi:Tol biopolymer transport system component